MSFRIKGLSPEPFRHLFGLPDKDLAVYGAKRYFVGEDQAFPDRIEMRDLNIGETAILLNYTHQPADTVYRSSHAIFVGETGADHYDQVDEVPEVMRVRPLSLRAFDAEHMMIDAELVHGIDAQSQIKRFFENSDVAYIHAHYARRGCYAGRIERA